LSLRDMASDFSSFTPLKSSYSVELPVIETVFGVLVSEPKPH